VLVVGLGSPSSRIGDDSLLRLCLKIRLETAGSWAGFFGNASIKLFADGRGF